MSGYGSIENQVLDTIEMIVSSAIEGAGYDRTVAASILSCVDTEAGKYKVKYQDAIYYATSNDAEKKYSNGAQVYILVPGNDFSKEKKIIGLVGDLKEDTQNQIDQNPYIIVGSNCGSLDIPQEYSSYKGKEEVILYKAGAENNILSINEKSLAIYIKDSTRIRIGMDFKTSISKMQEGGFYGLTVSFSEKNIQDTENPHIKTIAITNSDMIGYPYCSIDWITQSKDFEINGENFIKIEEVKFFLERFKEDEAKLNIKDIQIKNFVIGGLAHIDSAVMNTYFLDIQKPYGKTFNSSLAYTNLELKALLKLKNQPLISSTAIEYYWFKENPEIAANEAVTKDSIPHYHSCGGEGWECLNAFQKEVYDKSGNKATNETSENDKVYRVKWASQESYMVKKSDIKIEKVNYKCVAVRSGAILAEAETDIINEDAPYKMEIISDDGNFEFNDSIGSKNLTLKVIEKASGNQILNAESNGNKYRFYWGEITSTKTYRDITSDKTIPEYKIEGRDVYLEKRLFGSFKHVIGKTESGSDIEELIGAVSQKITNVRTPKEKKPYVNIENGEQVFIYDEAGISPNDSSKDPRQTLMPLTFSLYDADGKKIEMTKNFDAEITWFFPKENTMLQDARQKVKDEEGKEVEFSDTEDGNFIKIKVDGKYNPWLTLPFNIKNRYSSSYINNTVKLEVKYNNQVLQDFTNFIFTKEGKSRTNGTDTFGRIVLNASSPEYGFDGRYPTLVHFNDKLMINGGPNNTLIGINSAEIGGQGTNFPFKAELWKNGRMIESTGITWSLKCNREPEVVSYFNIETIDGNPILNFENISSLVNTQEYFKNGYVKKSDDAAYIQRTVHSILQAKISYKEENSSTLRNIYAELPLAIVVIPQNYNDNSLYFQVKKGTGFNEIVFNNDGTNPQVGSTLPFEIEVLKADGTPAVGNFTYDWKRVSNNSKSYLSFVARDIPLENPTEDKKTEKENEEDSYSYKDYQPAERIFSGYELDIALYCEVKKDGNLLGTIHFPIYALINKYGHAALNDWDGNSIKFQEDGADSYILTPQIGAGKKNSADNTFTGMVMGVVKTYDTEGNPSSKNGLIGYSNSVQSIYLSAEDGRAEFGTPGDGQIIISPVHKDNQKFNAEIFGGNYKLYSGEGAENILSNRNDGKGLLIDLTTPKIQYGSKKFVVDEDGKLTATGAEIYGGLKASSLEILPNCTVTNLNTGHINSNSGTLSVDIAALDKIDEQLLLGTAYGEGHVYMDGGCIYANTVAANSMRVGSGANLYATGFDTFEQVATESSGVKISKHVCRGNPSGLDTIKISPTGGYRGSKCLQVINTIGGDGYFDLGRGTEYVTISVSPSKHYCISAYVKASANNSVVQIYAVEHNSAGGVRTNDDKMGRWTDIGPTWKRVYFYYTPTSGYNKISLRLDLDSKTTAYFDCIQIEEISYDEERGYQLPSDFHPAGTTIIDGGMITTNTINAKSIITDTLTAVGAVKAGEFYLGEHNVAGGGKDYYFKVDEHGKLTAAEANIKGVLTAGSGSKLGPWNANTEAIYLDGTTYGSSGVYLGTSGLSISNTFKINNKGKITITDSAGGAVADENSAPDEETFLSIRTSGNPYYATYVKPDRITFMDTRGTTYQGGSLYYIGGTKGSNGTLTDGTNAPIDGNFFYFTRPFKLPISNSLSSSFAGEGNDEDQTGTATSSYWGGTVYSIKGKNGIPLITQGYMRNYIFCGTAYTGFSLAFGPAAKYSYIFGKKDIDNGIAEGYRNTVVRGRNVHLWAHGGPYNKNGDPSGEGFLNLKGGTIKIQQEKVSNKEFSKIIFRNGSYQVTLQDIISAIMLTNGAQYLEDAIKAQS